MSNSDFIVPVAHWTGCTEAEGPGKRFALWFQGCPMRCPGCCNPEMLPFTGGTPTPITELYRRIESARDNDDIEGISLLGGEPLAHAEGATALAQFARQAGLTVMVFSGYTLEEARRMGDPSIDDLLAATDILVDGRYERGLPDRKRRWIGSTNQRVHFFTDRYRPDDPYWEKKNTLEIRLDVDGLAVNGFPAESAVGLWRKLKPRMKREG